MSTSAEPGLAGPGRRWQSILSVVLAIAIAAVFLSQSRMPQLSEKAQMGLRNQISTIAFDVVLPVEPEQALGIRVLRSTVNWAYTNWRGMTFGLLFAAAALTVLGGLRRRSFRSPWSNTLSGVLLGAPLGVCVNCATPISQGLIAAGARLETALATLVSSPTLNVVVLTMTFTLLPWEMAVVKIVAVVAALLGLPLAVRWLGSSQAKATPATALSPPECRIASPSEGPWQVLPTVGANFARNLWFVVRLAVPLMLLAGLLGSLAIELVPFAGLVGLPPSVAVLAVAAMLAVLLPVPMAFDVVVVMALLAAGMDRAVATTLLVGLGIYSIYPGLLIGRTVSKRLALGLGAWFTFIAFAAGLVAQQFFDLEDSRRRQDLASGIMVGAKAQLDELALICAALPDAEELSCLSRHLKTLTTFVPASDVCDEFTLPGVTSEQCALEVQGFQAEQLARETGSTEFCARLADSGYRDRCYFTAAYEEALAQHDIDRCNGIAPSLVTVCRQQYLNYGLVFNPAATLCAGLSGREQEDCRINARIYELADLGQAERCAELPAAARDHCRYTVASTQIGRSGNAEGCELIDDAGRQASCRELVPAWRAERELDLGACANLTAPRLQRACYRRVSDRQIQAQLAIQRRDLLGAAASERNALPAAQPERAAAAPALSWRELARDGDAALLTAKYPTAHAGRSGGFERQFGAVYGLDRWWRARMTDFYEPFLMGKGVAAGDLNGDGWPDLALATERGVVAYLNTGGQFARVSLDQGALQNENVFLVALADLDGDGVQDLFATAYGGENYVLYNPLDPSASRLVLLPGLGQRLTLAAGFGDLNADGRVDIALGNWSSGVERLFSPDQSENALLMGTASGFEVSPVEGAVGETLSVLVSDLTGNGRPDVLFANDRTVPDVALVNSGEARLLPAAADALPITSLNTMSLDSGDFNNDGMIDLFSTDMSFSHSESKRYCAAAGPESDDCQARVDAFDALGRGDTGFCETLDSSEQGHCYAAFLIQSAKSLKDPSFCDPLAGAGFPDSESFCRYLAEPLRPAPAFDADRYPEQEQANKLLMATSEGFVDRTDVYGVAESYWSWNAQAADLDNDGWKDIYVGNGFRFGDSFYEIHGNVAYRNLEGQRFEATGSAWGLDDKLNTPSFAYLDLDLDGDLDIVATGVVAGPRLFVNNVAHGPGVRIQLEDQAHNTAAIGARVELTDSAGGRQLREIKMSGGFLSYSNPVAHFGLPENTKLMGLKVVWPDGATTEFSGITAGPGLYRVRRQNMQ